jgi:hypothetical protein
MDLAIYSFPAVYLVSVCPLPPTDSYMDIACIR